MEKIITSFKLVFRNPIFLALSLSLTFNLLFFYYFVFLKSTTLNIFFQKSTAFYSISSIILTVLISVFFGIAVGLIIYQHWQKKQFLPASSAQGLLGSFSGAISVGCPSCGAWLLSLLGLGGGLAAFPFQGLELKMIALIFLGWSIILSSEAIYCQEKGVCVPVKSPLSKSFPYLAIIFVYILIFALPVISTRYNLRFTFQKTQLAAVVAPVAENQDQGSLNIAAVLPENGFTVNASYGDIGPKLLASGVIDLEKFKEVYGRSNQPLTQKQLEILTKGSNEKITISGDSAYFLINFLWALGLANKNPILEEGPLVKYGGWSKLGGFASTGGWPLAKSNATDYYSKFSIVTLSASQQKELEDFAYNSYRPCCNNSSAFADCNHGMAALALGEIMASQGASANDMFKALKYFNAFWFPQQYIDLAKYFKAKEGKEWQEVDPRIVMGENYSTASGWSRVRSWLEANGLIEKAPSGGGGCGA